MKHDATTNPPSARKSRRSRGWLTQAFERPSRMPWVITGLVLGVVFVLYLLALGLPWGGRFAVIRSDLPTIRYAGTYYHYGGNHPLDLSLDDRGVVWTDEGRVSDLAVLLRTFRSESYREWKDDRATYSEVGPVRVRVHRSAQWSDLARLCAALIAADLPWLVFRCQVESGGDYSDFCWWLCDRELSGRSTAFLPSNEERWRRAPKIVLRSVDPADSERDRQRIRLRRERSRDTNEVFNVEVLYIELPPDLSVQAAFSLIECYFDEGLGGVQVAGLER